MYWGIKEFFPIKNPSNQRNNNFTIKETLRFWSTFFATALIRYTIRTQECIFLPILSLVHKYYLNIFIDKTWFILQFTYLSNHNNRYALMLDI